MAKILVIGESCRDIFVYCNATRLCPDVPVPVLNVVSQKDNPGMAYNVYRNICQLEPADILTNLDWRDVTKTRYVDIKSNQHFVRVDSPIHIVRPDVSTFPLDKYDLIAISDYNKGYLMESDIDYICHNHQNVFLDTKKPVSPAFASRAKYIKINDYEYQNSKPYLTPELEDKIIHTVGENGCNFRGKNFGVMASEVKDASGAGDTFFAALVVKYLQTSDIEQSIYFANEKASEVVRHKGVTTL